MASRPRCAVASVSVSYLACSRRVIRISLQDLRVRELGADRRVDVLGRIRPCRSGLSGEFPILGLFVQAPAVPPVREIFVRFVCLTDQRSACLLSVLAVAIPPVGEDGCDAFPALATPAPRFFFLRSR